MERKEQNKKLTLGAMMTALDIVLLLLGSLLPGMRLTTAALAGVIAAAVVVKSGLVYGVLTVVAVSLLSLLLVPSKGVVLLFAVFFGPYTILKNLIERLHSMALEWVIKLVFCAVDSVALLLLSDSVFQMVPTLLSAHIWLYIPVVLLGFTAYDIVFSKLIVYLFERIHW